MAHEWQHVDIMWSEGLPRTARPVRNWFHAFVTHTKLSVRHPNKRVVRYKGLSPVTDPVARACEIEEFMSSARRYR